jgi:4-hydroxybutyrate dehydrogenase
MRTGERMRPPDISYLTDIYFGFGSVARVPELLARFAIARPLVVTDATLIKLGLARRLGLGDAAAFAGTETNPTEANLRACLARYLERGCDGIVALGGGAPLDLAKLVGLMAGHPPPLEQYAILRGGMARIGPSIPPIVAVPTTAGSGSEVGRAALLKLDSGRKLGFLSPQLLPKAAVCDPELTLTLPPQVTAATGMDAISHCVETFCSTRVNAVADAIALEGLRRGWRAIRRAQADGSDREAREQMMHCSLMGGLAFQKSLGAVHSLSHPLGGIKDMHLHHGTLNALFLAPVLRFNYEACRDKMNGLAQAMGLASGVEVPPAFERLVDELGLPRRLRDLDVTEEALAPLAARAAEDHCSATNPRPLDEQAARRLYAEAW